MTAIPRQKVLRVKDVKVSPYNPPGRLRRAAMRELIDSISKNGLIYPILVDINNHLIDGHRRLAAVKELGWEEVVAIVHSGQRDILYAGVNSTSKKMTGNDALSVWLKAPQAVSPAQQKLFGEMEHDLGRATVLNAQARGFSARVYRTALRLCRHCGLSSDKPVLDKVFRWLVDCTTVGHVMKMMEAGTSAKLFLEAIEKQKPLHMRPTVGD